MPTYYMTPSLLTKTDQPDDKAGRSTVDNGEITAVGRRILKTVLADGNAAARKVYIKPVRHSALK